MALKRLSDVQEGQIIKIGGGKYQVNSKGPFGIVVYKELASSIFSTTPISVSNLIEGYRGPENHLVEVIEVGTAPKSDLTSELRQQVKQQSLTESLRAQIEDEEEDDWDEEEDEEEESCEGYFTSPHAHSHWSQADAQPLYSGPLAFPELEEVKQSSLTANLKAQQAGQTAAQAGLNAAIAKAKATNAQTSTDLLTQAVGGLQSNVTDLAFELDSVSREHDELVDEVYSLAGDVHALKQKQIQEEKKMSLQNELNQKLALQKKFNQTVSNNKTTGGNGTMKNVLGAFKNQFGKVEGKFAFSPITGGLALRKGISNDFVAYNKDSKELTDVSGLTLKFDVPAFKLPVAVSQVAVGDIVIHNAEFAYVTKKADGYLETINPEKAVRGSVIPTKNALLGAAFYTVVKTLDAAGEGGFNPMLLMALNKGGDKSDLLPLLLASGGIGGQGKAGAIDPTMLMLLGDDVEDLLPLVLMQQGGATGAGFNPLFFLLSQKGGKGKDLLPLLMMSGGLNGQATEGAGQINPMMMMALAGDGDIDFTTLALMGGLNGQGGLFGQATAPAKTVEAPKADDEK